MTSSDNWSPGSLGDIITELKRGKWEVLEYHYAPKRARLAVKEAVQEVIDDITAFTDHHYDGRSETYLTIMEGLAKWKVAHNVEN